MMEEGRPAFWLDGTTEPIAKLVGRVIDGRYAIEGLLGKGGVGVVFRARHVRIDKPVAVKVLRKKYSKQSKTLQRFEREARAASAIGNPHIVDIIDFGELPEGDAYIVMECLEGQVLGDAVPPGSALDPARALRIVDQLCDALGAAHDQGIVHRDLKPDNIYLARHGNDVDYVKVLDFGIAKVGGTRSITDVGHLMGTPTYMSPEQCRGAQVDHRTDIYALGVILYELVSGRPPFDSHRALTLAAKHMADPVVPPRNLDPPAPISPELEAAILKCLEKKPERRFQRCEDMAAALRVVPEWSELCGPRDTAVEVRAVGTIPNGHPEESFRHDSTVDGGHQARDTTDNDEAAPRSLTSSQSTEERDGPDRTPERSAHRAKDRPANQHSPRGATAFMGKAWRRPWIRALTLALLLPWGALLAWFGSGESSETAEESVSGSPAVSTIQIESQPIGAEVALDGTVVGVTPLNVPRPSRPTELQVRAPGYEPTDVLLTSTSDSHLRIALRARP